MEAQHFFLPYTCLSLSTHAPNTGFSGGVPSVFTQPNLLSGLLVMSSGLLGALLVVPVVPAKDFPVSSLVTMALLVTCSRSLVSLPERVTLQVVLW